MGVIGFDGPIDLQSLRLYGLPEAAPAVLNGRPLLPQSGQREFAAEVSWDLPNANCAGPVMMRAMRHQSILIPAAATTRFQRSISLPMKAVTSAGVSRLGAEPSSTSRAIISGSCTIRITAS